MRIRKGHLIGRRGTELCALAALSLCTFPVFAQLVPINVVATNAILDQFGVPLSRLNGGDLIQILFANGQIYPPNMDGTPHTNNGIHATAHIGYGTLDRPSTQGKFSISVDYTINPIFCRVWNTPTLDNPSYYGDSQIFTPFEGAVFYPQIQATTIAIDPADSDGDGLNNSNENDLGSDKNLFDTDGDGMGDFAEFRAGTDLTNNLSYLVMVEFISGIEEPDVCRIEWSSVSGKTYQIQYTTQELNAWDVEFSNINGTVTATNGVSSCTVTNGVLDNRKNFRILLVE